MDARPYKKSAVLQQQAREQVRQTPAGAERLSLDQGFQKYWAEHGTKLSPTWAAEVERYIVVILERTDPGRLLEDLTDAEVNAFVQMRRAEGAGLYGINRARAVGADV